MCYPSPRHDRLFHGQENESRFTHIHTQSSMSLRTLSSVLHRIVPGDWTASLASSSSFSFLYSAAPTEPGTSTSPNTNIGTSTSTNASASPFTAIPLRVLRSEPMSRVRHNDADADACEPGERATDPLLFSPSPDTLSRAQIHAVLASESADSVGGLHGLDDHNGSAVSEGDSLETKVHTRNTGVLQLAAFAFLGACGGPYGVEGAVQAGGPFYSFLAILVLPFVWSLGMALMTAELSTAMPHNMGYILWVQRAFGDTLGFLNGFISLFCNIIDSSLYPTLFVDYTQFFWGEFQPFTKFLIQLAVVSFITLVNIRGLDVVGIVSIVFTVLVLLPFVVFFFVGLPEIEPRRWESTVPHPEWSLFISIIMWNTSGWNTMGCVAGEVENPKRTYPLAMLIALTMMIISYLVPLSVSVGLETESFSSWYDGYFSEIADSSIGPWLGYWITFSAALSSLGMFNVVLATSARAIHGMAELGMVPSFLQALHPKYDTPHVAIVSNAVLILLVASVLDFEAIVEVDMFLYAGTIALEFIAFLYLKYSEPNMHRPFCVPGGNTGAWVMSIPPILLCLFTMSMASWQTQVSCVLGTVFGGVIYRYFGGPSSS